MKKFFYSRICKTLVIAVMLAAVVCSGFSLAWVSTGLAAYMGENVLHPQPYAQSTEAISGYLQPKTHEMIEEQAAAQVLYKDGKFVGTETVDISDFDAGIQNAKKNPDLTYKLEDLVGFYHSAGYVYLCWILDNRDRLTENSGEVSLDNNAADGLTSDALYGKNATAVAQETIYYDNAVNEIGDVIDPDRDRNGDDRIEVFRYPELYNVLYHNVRPLEIKYIKNASGGTIADYAQKNLETVSILDCYTNLEAAARNAARLSQMKVEKSNVMVWLRRAEDGAVYTNIPEWEKSNLKKVEKDYELRISGGADQKKGKNAQKGFCYAYDAGTNETYTYQEGNTQYQADAISILRESTLEKITGELGEGTWQMFIGLDTNYAMNDISRTNQEVYAAFAEKEPFGHHALPVGIISAIVFLFLLILTILQTGRVAADREIHTTPMEKFPIEILVLIDIVLWLILAAATASLIQNAAYGLNALAGGRNLISGAEVVNLIDRSMLKFSAIWVCAGAGAAILLCWDLKHYVRRIKARTMGGSLIRSLVRSIRKVTISTYRSKKEGQRLVIVYMVLIAVNVIIALLCGASGEGVAIIIGLIILVIGNILVLRKLMQYFSGRDAIRKGMDEIAAGNLDYKVDPEEASGYNREMAEGLNKVSKGLKNAVENEMKSERLKTDLITNVSHDIKTPLTSIINYIDILKRCEISDEKIRGYIDVLDSKSERLKQLVEDLVDSSKISSGNIKIDFRRIDFSQLILQMNGEFRERFDARNLSLICNLPEEPMIISADGNHLCRVIENLYSNVAKYAMPGSRVYVDGIIQKDGASAQVIVTIRNISEYPLNISAEELTERFVRGDLSRTTEGSGLGLEIARNLTLRQNGSFDIVLDGDLFKVIIGFEAK